MCHDYLLQGPYLDATREEDFLATAAAVADAAVSAFSGDMDPENEMTVDVQLTHTLERFAGSWPRLLLIGEKERASVAVFICASASQ